MSRKTLWGGRFGDNGSKATMRLWPSTAEDFDEAANRSCATFDTPIGQVLCVVIFTWKANG
jgi:hypothetical protein